MNNNKISGEVLIALLQDYQSKLRAGQSGSAEMEHAYSNAISPKIASTRSVLEIALHEQNNSDGYVRLLLAIFSPRNPAGILKSEFESWIKKNDLNLPLSSYLQEFHQHVLHQLISGKWALCFNSIDREAFHLALSKLKPREAEVLMKRFGINCNSMFLKDIAAEYLLSIERVRQIVEKALRKLRHPSRSVFVKYLVKTTVVERYEVLAQELMSQKQNVTDFRDRLNASQTQLTEIPFVKNIIHERDEALAAVDAIRNRLSVYESCPTDNSVYSLSVESLRLSIRSYNGLKNANILTLKMLTEKSEKYLLSRSNLGRKSVDEIKKRLQFHGLTLSPEDA